jgi:hypothetical protein
MAGRRDLGRDERAAHHRAVDQEPSVEGFQAVAQADQAPSVRLSDRARAGAPASGYLAPPRLITRAGVPNGDVFEAPGGYRANYSRIWGR